MLLISTNKAKCLKLEQGAIMRVFLGKSIIKKFKYNLFTNKFEFHKTNFSHKLAIVERQQIFCQSKFFWGE